MIQVIHRISVKAEKKVVLDNLLKGIDDFLYDNVLKANTNQLLTEKRVM